MAAGSGRTGSTEDSGGTAEPITLNDPDGAVTRVAPWSTWTREQVRAPGGEPALVTHLETGQLWFSAGRARSPWRHEIRVGPAVVSTPRGRFQATAEPDGGATIACLAGRTRVVAGLREPVVLGPDQTAAVSSDGATLVVMDRSTADPDLIDADGTERERPRLSAAAAAATASPAGDGADAGDDTDPAEAAGPAKRRRPGLFAEIVAIAALVSVLIAAAVVFSRGVRSDGERMAVPATSTTAAPSTTATTGPAATTVPITPAPTAPKPTPTTLPSPPPTSAIVSNPAARASGTLAGCRRDGANVVASVIVDHRSGGAAQFQVEVGLVDGTGTRFATGLGKSPVLDGGASSTVDVPIVVAGSARGACELVGVAAV